MKTVSIIGNRPQLMKLIPELADVCIWTGQHYDDALKGAYTKQIEQCGEVWDVGETSIRKMVERLIAELTKLPKNVLVTVYGDTDSTLAGAIAASQSGRKLVHVEAGLRCGNKLLPEERNRIAVDALCHYAYCPSNHDIRNIPKHRGVEALVVGDIMQERLHEMWHTEFYEALPSNKNDKWLVTIHRAENSQPDTMADLIKNVTFFVNRPRVYLHPKAEGLFRRCEKLRLSKLESAVPYLSMLRELWNCEGVITDSGGLMREAAWLGKKCIVLRNECEFPELVEANRIKLVGRDIEKLRDALEKDDWNLKVELENPNTTQKILDHLGIERRFRATEEAENVVCDASV